MSKLEEALSKKFEDNRLVFWYDSEQNLLEDFNSINLADVKKIHVQGNEFEVKYKVVREHPKDKFLLFFSYPKPQNEENWLLDLEMASTIFQADKEAVYLQELGLSYNLKSLVKEHLDFFNSSERRKKLKKLVTSEDTHNQIRKKMLAVILGTEYVNLNTFIHSHCAKFSQDKNDIESDLKRFNLEEFYWNQIELKFGYKSEEPTIYDFILEVFSSNFDLLENKSLSNESRLLLENWKDSLQFRESFRIISERVANDLEVEKLLERVTYLEILKDDLFKLCDYKIIRELQKLVISGEISQSKISSTIKERENKYFFPSFKAIYKCLESASNLFEQVEKYAKTTYETFEAGVESYSSSLYEIDLLYRKIVLNFKGANQNKILSDLIEKVEKVYSNDWLLTYNDNWQKVIDKMEKWNVSLLNGQQRFFENKVKPFIEKDQKLFVIISDALRYECGVELSNLIKSENRFESSVEFMVSSLPSYTQLCMASLLPHKTLSLQENSDTVLVDGMSSIGTQGREKILVTNSGVRATAINAQDLMNMNSNEGRDYAKNYDLLYIYHNRIDKIGDDKTTEEKVFEAVEAEFEFLINLLKRIANINGSYMLITSDHGFLYQNHTLSKAEFIESDFGGETWKENRRFVIGKDITGDSSVKSFSGESLNLENDINVLIPKSINRIKRKGSGSKFIHGGTTLQEIITPLIKVKKTRQDTVSKVEIDIIQSRDKITTNILPVSFLQTEKVTENVLPRVLKVGIYSESGELLSDIFNYTFDGKEETVRQREVKNTFQISKKAKDEFKNKLVKLILKEPIEGTSKFKEYKSFNYKLSIGVTNDFDDF